MLTRKVSIQFCCSLLVLREALTTRMGLDENAQTMDPAPAMVTTSILKRRGDTAALCPATGCRGLIHPHVVRFYSPPSETSVHSQPVLDVLPGCGRSARYRG